MAYPHPSRGSFRPQRERRHAASLSPPRHRGPREWDSLTSLPPPDAFDPMGPPRRTKKHHYQSSDEYQSSPKYASRHNNPRRSAGDIHSPRTPMVPTPPQILSPDRSIARLGPQRNIGFSDEEDDDEPRRSRARSRARSVRPKVRLRQSRNASSDSISIEVDTPTKTPVRTPAASRYRSEVPTASRSASRFRSEVMTPRSASRFRSTPVSRQPSPQSSSDGSDSDTDSTVDSLEDRTRRSPRSTVKDRRGPLKVPPPPSNRRALSRGRPRLTHRHDDYDDDDSGLDEDEDSEDDDDEMESDDEHPAYPRSIRHKSVAEPVSRRIRRPRHHSEPRSSSRRDIRRRDRHDESRFSWSKQRTTPKKHYASDTFSHFEGPVYSRMGGTPGARVPTAKSVGGGSTRRTTTFRRFFPATLQHRHSAPVNRTATCDFCNVERPMAKIVKLRCGHLLCIKDLKQKFDDCLNDDIQAVPSCCRKPIRVKKVQHFFDQAFKTEWNERLAERSTAHRIYCPKRDCRRWVFPSRIKQHRNGLAFAKCAHCPTKICCSCGTKWHPNRQCSLVNPETAVNLTGARRDGWRPCYNCRQLVEVKEGCDHMACACGFEFCMLCAKEWQACECPWFPLEPQDALDPMQTEAPLPGYAPYSGAPSPPRDPRGAAAFAPHPHRRRASAFDEKSSLGRRMQYDLGEYDEDEMYAEPLVDMAGINASRHFANDEFMSRGHAMVPPSVPSPGPGAGYVAAANKSRGSMERRLADRFTGTRHGVDPRFGTHMSPPPAAPMAPPAAPQPPPAATPGLRRHHTVDDETYGMSSPRAARTEVVVPRRATHNYMSERLVHAPARGPRMSPPAVVEPPKGSVMAGLTNPGSGMNRVTEWRNWVPPSSPPPSEFPVATS